MKILDKYHKQKFDKKVVKRLQKHIQTYNLEYDPKTDLGMLYASVFELGLKNKQFFESQFELIRNQNIDMWDNLSYQERNFIIKCDIVSDKMKQKKFLFEDANIYIPFFDRLLNHLYDEETAILELPQYFKLYDQFTDRIQSIKRYGFLPFEANMSLAKHILTQGNACILFDPNTSVFYKLENDTCLRYPILQKPNYENEKLSKAAHALMQDENQFIDVLIKEAMLHEKCIKKIEKLRSKGKVL